MSASETPLSRDQHGMHVILWRFRVRMDRESEFERAYGPVGAWTLLFRRGDGYLGTELLRRSEELSEYLTVDRWASRTAYEAFRVRFSKEYRRLDRCLEELTEEEALIGTFEVLG